MQFLCVLHKITAEELTEPWQLVQVLSTSTWNVVGLPLSVKKETCSGGPKVMNLHSEPKVMNFTF